jgi:hypothetical protein
VTAASAVDQRRGFLGRVHTGHVHRSSSTATIVVVVVVVVVAVTVAVLATAAIRSDG